MVTKINSGDTGSGVDNGAFFGCDATTQEWQDFHVSNTASYSTWSSNDIYINVDNSEVNRNKKDWTLLYILKW